MERQEFNDYCSAFFTIFPDHLDLQKYINDIYDHIESLEVSEEESVDRSKVEIAAIGHTDTQLNRILQNADWLKKVNLNKYEYEPSENHWCEARQYSIVNTIFSDNAEYVGLLTASWNQKYHGIPIGWMINHVLMRYLLHSKKLVLCPTYTCTCFWRTVCTAHLGEGSYDILGDLFNFDLSMHEFAPVTNCFISHRNFLNEYLAYIEEQQIVSKIEYYMENSPARPPEHHAFKNREHALVAEFVHSNWCAQQKRDDKYLFIPIAKRKDDWYYEHNIIRRRLEV